MSAPEEIAVAVLKEYVSGVIADAPTAQLILGTSAYADLEEALSDEGWDKLKDLIDTASVSLEVTWPAKA